MLIKAYRASLGLGPTSRSRPILSPPPCSQGSRHSDLLSVLQTHQASSHLRAFTQAASSARNADSSSPSGSRASSLPEGDLAQPPQ